MKRPVSEHILAAVALIAGGLVPVTMVNLASLAAMAAQPADPKARMAVLHGFAGPYAVWAIVPSLVVLAWTMVHARRHYPGLANRLVGGFAAGAVATIALDVFRLSGVKLDLMPADLPAQFGKWIVGPSRPAAASLVAGYGYHFLNGASFGLLYTVLGGRPRWQWGVVWGLVIELAMMTFPPMLMMGSGFFGLNAGLGVLGTTLVAHLAFGLILGLLVERWVWDSSPVITLASPLQARSHAAPAGSGGGPG